MKALFVIPITVFVALVAVSAFAQTAPTPAERLNEAKIHLETANSILTEVITELEAPVTEPPPPVTEPPPPSTEPPPPISDWVEPPVVNVPVLQPGTRPVVNIPGTGNQIRFTADIIARPVGTLQVAYEHATGTGLARESDPLVTPGDGSHPHDFAGTILSDTAALDGIHLNAPEMDVTSKLAQKGVEHWVNGIGHQPGLWHPSVYLRNGPQLNIGAGSALNYVRVPGAHLDTDRLFLLPNGCGYVSFVNRYHHSGDGKWRITFEGPTWARKSLLNCDTIADPMANHDAFHFGRSRPEWADTDGIPLALVSWYFKSGDLKLTAYPEAPALSFAGPNTNIEPHMDYVSASTLLPALDNIQIGQWMLDMTVNAHLFGGDSPLYGRFRLE